MYLKNKKINKGFTIIETMISVALFLVVVMVGMGSLLNTTLIHDKSRDMRSIMDNLSFIMEDMSRNIRTGYDYNCSNNLAGSSSTPVSCQSGNKTTLTFETSSGNPDDDEDQWIYQIKNNNILKYTAGRNGSSITLNPPEVKIDTTLSGFTVLGAEPPNGDKRQPFVIIKLVGNITDPKTSVVTPFSLQTSISQRLIDVNIQ